LLTLDALQRAVAGASTLGRTRQLIVATIGLVAIVALPAIAVYYARKRWRP
jgi:hypothetical protein